jgi:hypothetical protein
MSAKIVVKGLSELAARLQHNPANTHMSTTHSMRGSGSLAHQLALASSTDDQNSIMQRGFRSWVAREPDTA